MSELLERIREDRKTALRERDPLRLSTLRLLISDLENRRIELGHDLTDDEIVAVLAKAQKQRRESEGKYRDGGREELAEREAAEAEIIAEYLPEPLDEADLDRLIDAIIAEVGAASPGDVGKVMGRLMPQVQGRVEGAVVSRKVRERLG